MSGEINFYPVKKITTEFFESMKRGRLKNLDVLINKDGANSGKSSIYRKSPYLKAVVNEHLFILRGLKDKLDQEYLHYLIQSSSVKKILETKITGSAQPGLNSTFVQNFPVEIPPFPEQKKIASILTSVDDVIEKTQSQINKLQDLKKGMINKFLTKGIDHKEFKDSELGMIPRSWELIPLSQIANKKDPFSFAGGPFGSNLKTEHYCDSGIRIIQLQNIGDGEFLDNYEIFTSKEKANELLSCNIFPDDIIISKMGDPVARACIIPNLETRYLMASDGIRLSVNKNEFDVNFILETINHHRFRSEAERISIGSTRKRISLTELRTLIIAHPSLKEQKEISSFIHSINLSIKKKKQKLFKVQCLKKSLMQDLLTGKVRVSIN
jgi:type I restriction enzyme S subunit